MFSRRSGKTPRIDTLIGRTTRIAGDLEFSGGMHLDGAVTGNVRAAAESASTLSVSADGRIEGSVAVPNVHLDGTVLGDIRASGHVALGPKARVEGNVHYGSIEMAGGAAVQGKLFSRGRASPTAEAASPALVEPKLAAAG